MSELASDVVVNDRYEDNPDISLLAVDQYLREVHWTERLLEVEVNKLLDRVYRGNGERLKAAPNQWVLHLAKDARNQLVQDLQPLVLHVARRRVFLFAHADLLDVVQEANLGLLQALDTWVPGSLDFTLHAFRCMRRAVWRAYSSNDRAVTVSSEVAWQLSTLARLRRQWSGVYGGEPSLEQLAQEMGLSPLRVGELLWWSKQGNVQSVEALQAQALAPDREEFQPLYEVPASPQTAPVLAEVVGYAVEMLAPAQREVVQTRYGFGDGCTRMRGETMVGELLDMLPQGVHKLEQDALRHLAFLLAPLVAAGRPSVRSAARVPRYYSAEQAARLLGCLPKTVADRACRGTLPAVHHGLRWFLLQSVIDEEVARREQEKERTECACGCGQRTRISERTDRPVRYASETCRTRLKRAKKASTMQAARAGGK